MAVYCRMALTVFGVSTEVAPSSLRLASIINATTPDATPVAMLVPLNFTYPGSERRSRLL